MDRNKWMALVLFVAHFACGDYVCFIKQKNALQKGKFLSIEDTNHDPHLRIVKSFFNEPRTLCVNGGPNPNRIIYLYKGSCPECATRDLNCTLFPKGDPCKGTVDENREYCQRFKGMRGNAFYFFNIQTNGSSNCYICKNRGMRPVQEISENPFTDQGPDPAEAAKFMNNLDSYLTKMNESSALVSIGATKGIMVKQDELEIDEIGGVSVGYGCGENNDLLIADDEKDLSTCAGSVLISKEAFQDAYIRNATVPFAGIFRFNNMDKDELNSGVLLNQVIAIDMGTAITNLSDRIKLNFRSGTEEGIPSCRSWNGEGSLPNWTENGCDTIVSGDNVSCQCSHLTFFAVIMSPLHNPTISAADVKSLNYITYIGCGLSIFFLGIAFFMHFVMRRTKASKSKEILIQLMIALFLLNLSFLTNELVANLHSTWSCQAMAAFMHYSMLVTFTWFAMNALHLWLNFYYGGNISIQRYILKVSVTAWAIPIVLVVTLLILGKYGQIAIASEEHKTTMCWMTDEEIQYIINITYYAVVFLFTFSTLIVLLSWLYLTKTSREENVRIGGSSAGICSVFGLCSALGVTWGFAFFAHGVLRLPSYYIFTILNSFQGFFLFLYYYKTSEMVHEVESSGSSSQNMTDVTE
uniref:Adhesion G-protein coupled receptor G2-like n=1 Tax=Gadus morhua TaxID=8049 RepID=A0A8C4ZSU6_GADMO